MASWMKAVGLLTLVCVLAGCGEAKKAAAPKVMVGGTVNMDGKPMEEADAEIVFFGESPIVLPIKAGKFEGNVEAGDLRVEIRAYKTGAPIMMDGKPFGDPVKENYIPSKFNAESSLKASIPAGGTKDLKFDIESK